MVGRKLFEVAARDFCVDILGVENTIVVLKPLAEVEENSRQNLGVVGRAVVVKLAEF